MGVVGFHVLLCVLICHGAHVDVKVKVLSFYNVVLRIRLGSKSFHSLSYLATNSKFFFNLTTHF